MEVRAALVAGPGPRAAADAAAAALLFCRTATNLAASAAATAEVGCRKDLEPWAGLREREDWQKMHWQNAVANMQLQNARQNAVA